MADLKIRCPAGELVSEPREGRGPGCRCRIERSTLTMPRDPRVAPSVLVFCADDFAQCPTWRAMREAEMAGTSRDMERDVLAAVRRSEE